MGECKIVNINSITSIPEIVGENLKEWCNNRGISPQECDNIHVSNDGDDTCFIGAFGEKLNGGNFFDNLEKKIVDKKKEYIQLKNLEKEVIDYTNQRDFEILSELNKNKIQELIFLIIILIIAVCFGIYLIFNYLVVDK
tara:strand:- start:1439 stop:1855 length:417 start_codon:yes stop_codon:yes gene_type:complete